MVTKVPFSETAKVRFWPKAEVMLIYDLKANHMAAYEGIADVI